MIKEAFNRLKVALARKSRQASLWQYQLECPRCHQREYFGSQFSVNKANLERAIRCPYCSKYAGKTVEMTLIHVKEPSEKELEAFLNKQSADWRARHTGDR
jgi:phage FluMu protein Com